MLPFHLRQIRTVLCIGAHADDIEIGCGGTLLQLSRAVPDLHVEWAVFSGQGQRHDEAKQSADTWLGEVASKRVRLHSFADSYFPADWKAIKMEMQRMAAEISPDLVLTHRLDDRHQDHRILGDLSWNAFRNHLLLEYEIPKYEGDLGQPNLYIPLDGPTAELKIERLRSAFPTQSDKPWYDVRVFEGHLRMRGIECRAEFAEAFYVRKFCLKF